MDDPYERLRNAIILQAVRDYRYALKCLKMNPRSKTAKESKAELESFFRSKWYRTLTAIDGEMLIQKLNEEVVK